MGKSNMTSGAQLSSRSSRTMSTSRSNFTMSSRSSTSVSSSSSGFSSSGSSSSGSSSSGSSSSGSSSSGSSSSGSSMCSIHNSSLIMFCSDCRELLCEDCLVGNAHKEHRFARLRDAWMEQIKDVSKLAEKLSRSVEQQHDFSTKVSKAKQEMEEMFYVASEMVAEQYRELRELIDQNQQQAFLLIQAQKESRMLGLNRLAEEGEQYSQRASRATKAVAQLQKNLEMNSAAALLEVKSLHNSIETIDDFFRTFKQKIHLDNRRMLALKNSVATIIEKNMQLLPRPWEFAENLTFDEKMAHGHLRLSDDKTQVQYVPSMSSHMTPVQRRGRVFANILASQSFRDGRHYWEVEVKEAECWTVGVVEHGWVRQGMDRPLGEDRLSWGLQLHGGTLVALHADETSMVRSPRFERLGIFLNYSKGQLQFYSVDSGQALHVFYTKFKNPLYPAFSIGRPEVRRKSKEKTKVQQLILCDLVPQNFNHEFRDGAQSPSQSLSSSENQLAGSVVLDILARAHQSSFI